MFAMYNTNVLLRHIMTCQHVIQIHVNTTIDAGLFDVCIQQQEKGLAVVLVISDQNRQIFENDPFLLNRCLQLSRKGALVYTTDAHPGTLLYTCISDFKTICHFHTSDTVIHTEAAHDAVRKAIHHFNTLVRSSIPFRASAGGVRLTLDVSEDLVTRDTAVTLTWHVQGADKVFIEGLGEVEPSGQRQVLLTETTLFKAGAYNDRSACIAATHVWVAQKTVIDYDIGFISAQTNGFYSLVKAGNDSDTYGTAAGNRICLRWRVLHAARVHIHPFGLTAHEGEYTFCTAASMDISIVAQADQQTLTRKIILLVFPIPVFRDKLFSPALAAHLPAPDADATPRLMLTLHDAEERYQYLLKKIHAYTSDRTGPTPTLSKLNAFVFQYLKRMNAGKKGVRRAIESIERYYEQR